ECLGTFGAIPAAGKWDLCGSGTTTPVRRNLMERPGIHVVFLIYRFDVPVEPKIRMVHDIKILLIRTDTSSQKRVCNDANPPADELIEFAKTAVRAHWYYDGDRREIVALPEHFELDDSLEITRLLLKSVANPAYPAFCH